MRKTKLTGWRERCRAAGERGWFTVQDQVDAAEWKSCAVGEAMSLGLFDVWGVTYRPVDSALFVLGAWFGCHVCKGDVLRAQALLTQIEERIDGISDRIYPGPPHGCDPAR